MAAVVKIPPTLYHASSSFYSMIARLALIERSIPYVSRKVDIHRRGQQFSPEYVRINPHMTVPTLIVNDKNKRILADSRDILYFAFEDQKDAGAASEAEKWVARVYDFPVDEFTVSRLISSNPIARTIFPKKVRGIYEKLLRNAEQYPDLAPLYLERSKLFAHRVDIFQAKTATDLYETRWKEVSQILDDLDKALHDDRAYLTASGYSTADVVATILLGRVRFIGQGAEVQRRKALCAYEARMFARPSFGPAEVWTAFNPLRMLVETFKAA